MRRRSLEQTLPPETAVNNPLLILALRLIHIVSGVLWTGVAVLLAAYVLPAARGEGGMAFLRALIAGRNLPRYLNVALGLTLLSGLALYGNLAALTHGAWVHSSMGRALALGALAAIIAAIVGTFVAAPAVHRAIALAGQKPADDAELVRARERYANAMRIVAGLLLFTAATMAVGRYLP